MENTLEKVGLAGTYLEDARDNLRYAYADFRDEEILDLLTKVDRVVEKIKTKFSDMQEAN